MQILGLLWGILAIVGMIIGFVPCLGALNWLNIPFAGIGILICGVALAARDNQPKGPAIAGLIFNIVALFFGIIRLIIGAGIV